MTCSELRREMGKGFWCEVGCELGSTLGKWRSTKGFVSAMG
jgi:hypothetical protein